MSIPSNRNVIQENEVENKLKYKSLYIEIQECMILLVVTEATGIVTKVLKKNLEAVPGKHSIDLL